MNSILAFMNAKASANKEPRVFDWDKAARLIAERKPNIAVAGLKEDMEYTAGVIWREGEYVTNKYTYLASSWATPVLVMDDEEIDCYTNKNESPWEAHTKWPLSAIKIVEGE